MNLTNIGTVKDILGRHGFSFSKGLGQNFIINPDICPKIAENGNKICGILFTEPLADIRQTDSLGAQTYVYSHQEVTHTLGAVLLI